MHTDKIKERQLNTLATGARFICSNGDIWIKGREHGSHNDVFLATRERDGFESCFGGSISFPTLPDV